MAFNPRTDVVLEVASAADPSRATLAAQRLNALAGANASPADFVSSLKSGGGRGRCNAFADRERRRCALTSRRGDRRTGQAWQSEDPVRGDDAEFVCQRTLAEGFRRSLTAREWPATCGDRCSPSRFRRKSPSPASLALPSACSRPTKSPHIRGALAKRRRTSAKPAAQMSANILSAPAAVDPENGAVLFAGRKPT